jgi:SAM-dependent methyltransferase
VSQSVRGTDPLGRAIYDHYRGEREEPLVDRDGARTREQPIERFYFGEFDPGSERGTWVRSKLDGPLLDIGAGAGRDALYFQDRFETIATDVSEFLVETMRERGVRDVREVDMFALREAFDRDRFRSVLVYGTQIGLAGSIQGLREFLGDLAFVTKPDVSAAVHGYDPEMDATGEILGYRADPTPGLAYRVYHSTYEDAHETLLFRLFSPDRLREAAVGTGWEVAEVKYASGENPSTYLAALRKRRRHR